MSREDRIIGCLVGGALGDAIGSRFEGAEPPASCSIPSALRVSDDTQLTLATCEAIIESGRVDPGAIAARFLNWFRRRQITGIGSSTLKALTELSAGGHWACVGASGEYAAGNGAAMRIAPLAFVLDPNDDVERRAIRDVARITHRNEEAYMGALALVWSVNYVIHGNSLDRDLLSHLIAALPDSRIRDRLVTFYEDSTTLHEYPSNFQSTGYVVDSVPLAVLAAVEARGFMPTMSDIVKLGGDTDTVASMCGQILGAAHGSQFIPRDIADRVDMIDRVRQVASEFARVTSVT